MPKSAAEYPPYIAVLAGANGAGKSRIIGAFLREHGGEYYNPDEAARRLLTANPALTQHEANGLAWRQGVALLRAAIADRHSFVLETTLGGETVTALLVAAVHAGMDLRVWFVGLATPEQHLQRVAARVGRGGHAIPEELVRRRFDQSRLNLIRLIPQLTELHVFDNSAEGDPAAGLLPEPRLVIYVENAHSIAPMNLRSTPDWAKPIVAAVLKTMK